MSQATFDDVNLLLRLYELRREEKMRAGREWFVKSFRAKSMDEFNQICPPGSQENAYYRMVVTYWEMVASFITSGVLNEELFFQSGMELLLVWEKIRAIVPAWREGSKNPAIMRNIESVAASFIAWLGRQSADAYPAFAARVAAM